MTQGREIDWNPGAYERFRDLRLRPALDLLGRVGDLPPGTVVDLGCGAGAVAPALSARFSGRALVGVDTSPAMLDKARERGLYGELVLDDIARWRPDKRPALIFSNAALHWLGDHATLLPRLAGFLAPDGTLAVQMPAQHNAPSHRIMRELAAGMFPDRFDFSDWSAPVWPAADYARLLAGLGEVDARETTFIQRLAPAEDAHPVRRFTESTAMRPFIEKLDEADAKRFVDAYEDELAVAYPVEDDGSVLFPFTRVFFTLRVPA